MATGATAGLAWVQVLPRWRALAGRTRRDYAVTLALAFGAIAVPTVFSYRTVDQELTQAALSRNAAPAELAAVACPGGRRA